MQVAPNNWLHLGATAAGAWGAYHIAKGRTGMLQYLALAAGAWGLYRFSQYGWLAAPTAPALPGAGVPMTDATAAQLAAAQAAGVQPGAVNPWATIGQSLGSLTGAIYDLATEEATAPAGTVAGFDYSTLPYEAPPPGY